MPGACTIVIGAQQHLDALRSRADTDGDVLTFLDTDPLGALAAIAARRPDVVIFERLFAVTSRGAALINRIKADPALLSAEIRVMSHDGDHSRVSPRRAVLQRTEPLPADPPAPPREHPMPPAAASVPEAAPRLGPELDWRGTRRAARVRMKPDTEAQVDGAPATIVDLSELGAQVVAYVPLRPHQRVWMAMGDDVAALRFDATVAWASFEIPQGVTRYRAGLEFRDAAPTAVLAFAARHKE